MSGFLLKKTDVVPIKKTSSGGPVNVSVGNILGYGRSQGYGNSFVLYDCGNSRAGLGIRYFNVTTDTIYLATTTFLSDTNSYIGVGIYDNQYIQSPQTTLFGSTGSGISAIGVSTNFLSQTVSGIQYGKNGGNLSGYGSQQAFYIDESVATIYIDNELVPIPEPDPSKWRQIFFGNSVLLSEGTIVDEAVCENGWTIRKQDQVELDFINLYLTGEMINSNQIPEEETEVYRKGQYYITVCQSSPGQWSPDHGYNFKFKKDGEELQLSYSTGGNGSYQGGYKFAVAINETEHRGAFVIGHISYSNYAAGVGRGISNINPSQSEINLYNWLKAAEPGASVKVTYFLPDDTYQYTKLTYKRDVQPESVNDGTIVNLDPSQDYVTVDGLVENASYWFKIFTNKSESEAFPYTVGPIPSRFTIAKQFKSDNGTFNYNIPSWIEENIISTLENDPLIVSMYFYVGDYPEVANLYNHQFVEYPLQFRTYYGTYPDTGSRPATSYYVAKDYKLEWLWNSGSTYRDETDYYKNNGEWINSYTASSGYSIADNNYESFVTIIFILDHEEKKGYPAYVWWGHSERWSMNKYRLQVSKLGVNSRYDQLTSAIYDALK